MFEIITTEHCSFCIQAKSELSKRALPFKENVLDDMTKLASFREAGFKTVPQIYHNGNHIGGYSDLVAWLEKNHSPAS